MALGVPYAEMVAICVAGIAMIQPKAPAAISGLSMNSSVRVCVKASMTAGHVYLLQVVRWMQTVQ